MTQNMNNTVNGNEVVLGFFEALTYENRKILLGAVKKCAKEDKNISAVINLVDRTFIINKLGRNISLRKRGGDIVFHAEETTVLFCVSLIHKIEIARAKYEFDEAQYIMDRLSMVVESFVKIEVLD